MREERIGVPQQVLRMVEFLELPTLQHQDLIGFDDRVEPVGDRDDCAVLESAVHSLVDDAFRSDVDVGRGLVDQDDLRRF